MMIYESESAIVRPFLSKPAYIGYLHKSVALFVGIIKLYAETTVDIRVYGLCLNIRNSGKHIQNCSTIYCTVYQNKLNDRISCAGT